jgi:hypothetical protein
MEDGLYMLAGEAFDTSEVLAGARIARKIKRKLKKLGSIAKKIASPALGVASFAMPALAPAAAAAAIATKVAKSAKRGHRPARAAMHMLAHRADRGDADAQRFVGIAQRVSTPAPKTLLNAAQMRELALRARQGNPTARSTLEHVANLADEGDKAAQLLIEQAAGSARWDLVAAGHSLNQDLEILGSGCEPHLVSGYADIVSGAYADIVSGGSVWDRIVRRGTRRPGRSKLSSRDLYRLGLEAASSYR